MSATTKVKKTSNKTKMTMADVAQLLNLLPPELVNQIRNTLHSPPPRAADMNCGKFINTMTNRYGSLKEYKERLRTSVVKTLERFESILGQGHYLRHASMTSREPTMWTRTQDKIHEARRTQSVEILVKICQQIPRWKQEANQIVKNLEDLAQHMEQYLSTGKISGNPLRVRLVPATRFKFFGNFQTYNPSHPDQRKILMEELQTLQQNLQKDVAALAILSQPLQIVPDPRNCGEYMRLHPVKTGEFGLDPRAFQAFKNIVLKTLQHFCRELGKTNFIKKSAIVDPGSFLDLDIRPMKTRVEETIQSIQRIQQDDLNHNELITACAKVVSWKKESALIVTRLQEYIQYLETYVETGKRQNEPLKNIVVNSMNASMHQRIPKLVWNQDRHRIRQYIGQYKACLVTDQEMLEALLATIDVR